MGEEKPIVLIIRAQTDPPLRELDEEADNVREALLGSGGCEPHTILAVTADKIFEELDRFGDRIVVVHYAGHANGEGVQLRAQDDDGSKLAHVAGLAGRFGQLKNLRLLFLNGCATKDQVPDLYRAGIPAVIATLRGIDDGVARDFASGFYKSMAASSSIGDAFATAESRIVTEVGNDRAVVYGLQEREDPQSRSAWPWEVYGTDDAKGWKLADRRPEDDVALAGQGLASLKSLLSDPAVKAKVLSFQSDFLATREGIRVLQAYKEMHDVLHTLQFQCHEILVQAEKLGATTPAVSAALVTTAVGTLQQQLQSGAVHRALLPERDTDWFGDLEQAHERLRESGAATKPGVVKEADDKISHVISVHLSSINTRLNSQARNLRLDLLLEGLSLVEKTLGDGDGIDADHAAKFRDGLAALLRLDEDLHELVDEHDAWQNVDREVRPAESSLAFGTQMLAAFWPNIKARLDERCAICGDEDRAVELRAASETLDTAIAGDHANAIEAAFRDCHRLAGQQFYRIDLKLKSLCAHFAEVGEELSHVLRELT